MVREAGGSDFPRRQPVVGGASENAESGGEDGKLSSHALAAGAAEGRGVGEYEEGSEAEVQRSTEELRDEVLRPSVGQVECKSIVGSPSYPLNVFSLPAILRRRSDESFARHQRVGDQLSDGFLEAGAA